MRTRQIVAFVVAAGLLAAGGAAARVRHAAPASDNGVPYLDVKGSCTDAQKFSNGDEKKTAYSGCLQDEMNAKAELAKRWGDFKAKDRSNCVEQSRNPSPSYVEVLTCLEMDTDAIRNSSRPMPGLPPIGGPVAPGLTTGPAASTPAPSAPQPQ